MLLQRLPVSPPRHPDHPVDIPSITTNLTRDSEGVWVAADESEVSYPSEGNQACMAVEDTSFWFRHRNNVISHLVKKLSPNEPFFDIGGGNGCVSYALQERGVDVVLVEPGPSGVQNAVKRGVTTVIQSTLENAGFDYNSIPSAGLFDVVEHIESDAAFLQNVYKYLKPGGYLYVMVPAYNFLWSAEDVVAGHFRRYTASSLTERLTEAGFKVNSCGYLFSFLVPPIFLLRSIPSYLGFRKTSCAATMEKEHSTGRSLSTAVVDRLLQQELDCVRRGRRIPFGSSCIAVATK